MTFFFFFYIIEVFPAWKDLFLYLLLLSCFYCMCYLLKVILWWCFLTIWPSFSLQYKLMNDSHHQLIINWAGEGSKVVVCMTRDSVQDESSTSNVYVSYDYGTTFQEKTSNFRKASQKPAIINKMYKNDKFTSVVSWS